MFLDLTRADLQPAAIKLDISEINLPEQMCQRLQTIFEEKESFAKVYRTTSVVKPDNNYVFFSNHWYYLAVLCRKYAQALYPYCAFFDSRIRNNQVITAELAAGRYNGHEFISLFDNSEDRERMVLFIKGNSEFRPGKALLNIRDGNRVTTRSCKDIFGSCVLKKLSVPDASSAYLGNIIYYLAEHDDLFADLELEINRILSGNDVRNGKGPFCTCGNDDERPFSVEWFRKKALDYPTMDHDAEQCREAFLEKYSPEQLAELNGLELLRGVFLNDVNKDNLCYELEYGKDCKKFFGGIGGGAASKYGLYYNNRLNSWVKGKNTILSEGEAIETATQIRNNLLEGAKIVMEFAPTEETNDYLNLYKQLNTATDGYVNRVWFLKYYQMLRPDVFSTVYGSDAQKTVLSAIGVIPCGNSLERMCQICRFAKECGVSNVLVGYIFYEFYNDETADEDEPVDIDAAEEITEIEPYSREDFLKEVFFTSEEYDGLYKLLMYKKNVILQGAPGVGKTFLAKRFAYSVIGEKNDKYIEIIQFHQNYSYEDFIMGYKPTNEGFELKTGIFYDFCRKAEKDPDHKYFFIVDEINRGNLSKVFGELMMLIERDKRGKDNRIKLAYRNEEFFIPENIYFIGMMNTADRSLAMMDYALRRRFCFFDVNPAFEKPQFREYISGFISHQKIVDKVINRFVEMNKKIADEENSGLGRGFCIGHSYFCIPPVNGQSDKEWYDSIIEYEIAPLLDEYWWDDKSKAEECINDLTKE